jgi:hydrogenase maturation factor
VILCTYGDCLRVPASDGLSLMKAKARGGDIRMVYSSADALQIARDNPERAGGVLRHRLRDHHAADGGGHPSRPPRGA